MVCTYPVTLVKDGVRREVACGRCMACRLSRAREWSTRCMHEAAYWSCSSFLTLTYRDDALPEDGGVSKEELQRFHKRLRKHLGRAFRYYACGEYGEKTGRPHYHGVYFGLAPCVCDARPDEPCLCPDRTAVRSAWTKGGVPRLGTVTAQSTRYVASYVGKKLSGTPALREYGGREPPFSLMSQGLGRRYCDDHSELLVKGKLSVNGVPVGLPRYYVHRLGVSLPMALPDVKASKRAYVWTRRVPDALVAVEGSREQRDKNLSGRFSLKERDETRDL